MTRAAATAALVAAALGLSACGGGDDESKPQEQEQASRQKASHPERSTLDCLDYSLLSPERHKDQKGDAPPEARPLITGKAQASSILGGDEFAAVVIEYPDEATAKKAQAKARESKQLAKYMTRKNIVLINDVLFLDYSEDKHRQKIVRACAERPHEPPPTATP